MGTNCAPLLTDLFLYSYKNEFLDKLIVKKAKESLLESSIYHILTLMTLSLSIIKDLRSSFLIFTPKNSKFLKPQALVTRLLLQGYKVNRLSNTFKKFYGRHTDLVG